MPELPEVETVKNVLKPILIGRTIQRIDVLRMSSIVGDSKEFVNTIEGKTFEDITRIGKFLIFHLNNDVVFISHLRMEGKYFEVNEAEQNTKYSRVVFHLDNNHKICYDDSRCFGMMKLTSEKDYMRLKDIASLGPEPFKIDSPDYLLKKYRRIKKPIKSTLLDQTIMTGLGNIYADEVLFACKIHPLTPANMMTKEDCENIIKHSQRILNNAIKAGGSTIKSYHPGKDIDGNFQTSLVAYGKGGEKCPLCGATMRFKKVGGRGSTYCPKCQIKKGASLKVAIYGKIASGKSSVLEAFKANNIPVISSDEIVHELYKKEDVISKIQALLNMDKSSILDTMIVSEIISKDIKLKKKLEKFIHPLVRKEVEKFLSKKEDILVVEVPLLFEAKFDNLFDYFLLVDIDEQIRNKRLFERNKEAAKQLESINKNKEFASYKEKADFVVNNNNGLEETNKQVKQIINTLTSRLN